jgi:exopolysaccharide production protein ExoZ
MKKYHGIQILRFIAASLVVAEHLILNVFAQWSNAAQYAVPPFGKIGVIVFFGISGFIMVTTQYETFGSAARALDFFWRRILRILPIYAIATTLQFINKRNAGGDYTVVNYVKSLLFVPYLGNGKLYQPVLAQGWTLNLEMFFYLVFALSLMLPRVRGLLVCMLAFVVLAAMQGSAADMGLLLFYANHILLFFVCGMLVGVACKHSERSTATLALPLAAWAVLLPAAVWVNLYAADGVKIAFNLVMVVGCVWTAASYQAAAPGKFTKLFERLGDASYSTYLFHGFMLGALKFLSNRVAEGETLKMVLLALFAVVLGNLLGLLMFTFVERPIARLVKTWTTSPRAMPA